MFWHVAGLRRVPRAASFHAPLNLSIFPTGTASPSACPLPTLRNTPKAAWLGRGADEWTDHHARYVMNARGQRIFVQEWRPLSTPRGCVFLVHGLNDHSNKYQSVAKEWVDAGYIVIAHDCHGHGRSDGFRAYAASIQHYVDDAALAITDSVKRLPSKMRRLPKFLLGHSLGGAVAIHLARDAPPSNLHGVMLTAPAVRVYPRPILRMFAPLIATIAPLLPVQKLRFDHTKQSQQKEDPLVVRCPVRARVGYEVLKSCDKIMSEARKFRLPLFVAHSRGDKVTNARGSLEFYARVASKDKTMRLYDGRTHDLLAATSQSVLNDMLAWADQRLRRVRV